MAGARGSGSSSMGSPAATIMISTGLSILALVLGPIGASGAPTTARVENVLDMLAEARDLLASGDAPAALAKAETALEFAPSDPALLGVAAHACAAADDPDRAFWYAGLARASAEGDKQHRNLLKELDELVETLPLPAPSADALLADFAEERFKLAKLCQRRKLYANAVDLLSACKGTPFEAGADERLEKLFENEKAVEALLASGIEIPAKPVTKKSPDWIAKQDAEHAHWDDPWEVETKYYTVLTNMGFEMAQSISLAMEQMNQFYRQVFNYKVRGGTMRRCVLKVYAHRREFDAQEGGMSPGVKGFFVPLENRVATYDPRSEGQPVSKLWSTLFHEASHQFTEAVTTNLMPGWLNEGTASYFEGAQILPSGQIRTNLIPESRLRNLVILLDQGKPTVEEVVSYFQPGSYDGSFYPFGWGLVYFIRNFEDENSERPYLPVYLDFMQTYTKGGKHDVFGRFCEYFVEKADQPGIDTFEQFVERWEAWIRNLHEVHFGGPEEADAILALARKQVANGKLEYARESYGRVLDKRPADVTALMERAQLLLELEQEDAALFDFRRMIRAARSETFELPPDLGYESREDLLADCLARITEIDKKVGEGLGAGDEAFVAATQAAARQLAEAGFPLVASQLIDTSAKVLGGEPRLAQLRATIESEGGVDLRRWRRLSVADELAYWEAGSDFHEKEGGIRLETDTLVMATTREEVPETYRYEVTVRPGGGGEFPVFGLVFGASATAGSKMFGLLPSINSAGLLKLDEEGPDLEKRFVAPPDEDGAYALAVEVSVPAGRATFFCNGEEVGSADISPYQLRGRVGVFGQTIEADFTDLRVLY